MLGDIVAQSGNQGTIISLRLTIFLWMVCGRGNMSDAEAGKRVLNVSRVELWAVVGQKAIKYAVSI